MSSRNSGPSADRRVPWPGDGYPSAVTTQSVRPLPSGRPSRPAEVRQIWPPRYVRYRIDDRWRLGQLLAIQYLTARHGGQCRYLVRTLSGESVDECEPRWFDIRDIRPCRTGRSRGA